MAKAQITTPQGIHVKIEGTPAEITAVVHDLETKSKKPAPEHRRGKAKQGRVLLVERRQEFVAFNCYLSQSTGNCDSERCR